MSERQRVEKCALPATLAMAAPAVRMAVVHAWCWRDRDGDGDGKAGIGHEIIPVLALVAKQQFDYSRYHQPGRDFRAAATPDGMEALGWHLDSSHMFAEFDVVICDHEYGICDATFALGASNAAHEVVVCPWPPEEDEARLAAVVERVRADARGRVEAEEKRRESLGAKAGA